MSPLAPDDPFSSTVFKCFLHFSGIFLTTTVLLLICSKKSKKVPSDDVDSDPSKKEISKKETTQKTDRRTELESQLLELLEELSDSEKRKLRKKKHRKKKRKHKKRKSHDREAKKASTRKDDLPQDAPRKIPLNEKEQRIAKGAKVASSDYPTMDANVKSDWDPE